MRNDMHPDMVLLLEAERQKICCLVVPDCVCTFDVLHPFHQYHTGGLTAFLFDDVGDVAAFMAEAEYVLEGVNGEAGMSGPFALSVSARGCLNKARLALETGKRYAPERRLYTMGEFGEAALIEACAKAIKEQGFCAGDFCDGVLEELEANDMQAGTQYVQSLRGYLENRLDLRLAASKQGIHRNTLAYRIRRIQERFALDLSNKNACFELLFCFWLREHFDHEQREIADEKTDLSALLWRYVERQTYADSPTALCVGYIDISRLSDAERDALVRRLHMAGEVCAFHDDEVILACAPEDEARMEANVEAAREGLSCLTAFSGVFSSDRLRQKLALCRWAIRISGQRMTRLSDVSSTLFFAAVSRGTALWPYYCEEVIRVMDEDATKGSSLSRSLFVYLLNFNDMKEAAEQIGMHRNTMEYQMRKIEGFIGAPLSRDRRFMMMCTYRMLALPDMDAV